ncbi:hypothetical protein [Streptomyces sp. NRRL F-5727]|uniref:hypothetical protein n=1 Tax=Streptomyces sp. NRRL F-5727 TaxID=1463871 RepID=UPI0004CACEF5|nr:hypothetical protein [Streptomyces sp. NRRL F-5727]
MPRCVIPPPPARDLELDVVAIAIAITTTAHVTSVRWTMGDGTTVTRTSPGTPYTARYGARDPPTCGHRHTRPAEYSGTATATATGTATRTDQWEAPALADAGPTTESRSTPFTTRLGKVQAVDTSQPRWRKAADLPR